ncbi:hypothetical protein BC828DRAFT_349202 [Blastocladiella britannica]|nr:hypothetical protein BC828DRAFT_349202 [Blastocladiella britannica]
MNTIPATLRTPHVSPRVRLAIESLLLQLRRRQLIGSHLVAERILDVMRMIVSSGKWGTVDVLIDLIKLVGGRCQLAQPTELCIGNTVRRLLAVIREECHQLVADNPAVLLETTSLAAPKAAATGTGATAASTAAATAAAVHAAAHHHGRGTAGRTGGGGANNGVGSVGGVFSLFPDADSEAPLDLSRIRSTNTKFLFVETVNEMIDELRSLHDSIAGQSLSHIHSNEIILTCGDSTTAATFFKYAAKKRTFSVIVVESAPSYAGRSLAATLAASGIDTTLIPDAAAFAVMSRVNKVVLSTHAVLANGGLVATAGAEMLAAAAKHYGVPVVVVAGLYKLTPRHPFDVDALTAPAAPAAVARYADDALVRDCEVIAPTADYVPPELVSLFITNEGAFPPSYIYRLLSESFHPDDLDLVPRAGAFDRAVAAVQRKGVPAPLPAASARASKASSTSTGKGMKGAVAAAVEEDSDSDEDEEENDENEA